MKQKILVSSAILFIIFLAGFIYLFILSFKVVKQNTDNINRVLKNNFQSIVRIPDLQPSFRSFEKTVYTWEMETREKEVTSVAFIHDTGLPFNQDKIMASLEMPQGHDPSLFVKVMPAVVSDTQALTSAQDLEHANLGPNEEIGYSRLEFFTRDEKSPQVIKISWEFDKEKITAGSEEFYQKLYKYPQGVLTILYAIQRAALIILSP